MNTMMTVVDHLKIQIETNPQQVKAWSEAKGDCG